MVGHFYQSMVYFLRESAFVGLCECGAREYEIVSIFFSCCRWYVVVLYWFVERGHCERGTSLEIGVVTGVD